MDTFEAAGLLVARVARQFRELFGRSPEGVWRAPGRVNLIGEHTDYNAGLALPFAIDRSVVVACARRRDGQIRCWSAQQDHAVSASLAGPLPDEAGWAAYLLGALRALHDAGVRPGGLEVAIDSTLPAGAGLSSSAALVAALSVAVDGLCEASLGPRRLAELGQRAESEFVGVPVGLLDPMAVLCGRAGHALRLDFRDGSAELVPLDLGPLVVVDSGIRRRVGDGRYAERRAQCQAAAAELGVPDLRHASLDDLQRRLSGVLQARARHVVTENHRVDEATGRLRAGRGVGDLLWASHASLRDDFAASCPEVDAVVDVVGEAGAAGARLTGAGFGGSVIVVGLDVEAVEEALARRFGVTGPAAPVPDGADGRPRAFAVSAVDGAGQVDHISSGFPFAP